MAQKFSPCVALVGFSGSAAKLKEALFMAVKNGARTANFRIRTYDYADISAFLTELRKGSLSVHGVVIQTDYDTIYERPFASFIKALMTYGVHRMVYAAAEPEVEGVVYTEDEIEGILSMCGLPPENFAVEGCIPEMYRQPGDEEEEHVFELVKQINQVIIAPAVKDEVFRMPIMQSFNVKNIATVAIGRVTQGTLQVGDHVEIVGFEKRMPARVVRLDMASKSVDEIMAGDNASVALAGVSATEVQKGQMVTAPGTTEMTDVLRAMVYVRKESNDARGLLRNKSRLTLSTDCLDATALVLMEGKDYCIGGDYAPIEIRLIQEIPYVHGMRFWLRDEKDVIAEGSVI